MLRFAAKFGLAAAAFLVLLAAAAYSLLVAYYPQPPKPAFARPASLADAQRDDLAYLRKLPWLDWSYTPQTRAAAEQVIDKALEQKFPLKPAAFDLVVARVNALADNGHSTAWVTTRANTLDRLPLRLYAFTDGVFVIRALPVAKSLLGAQVLAIDGRPVSEIARRVSIYTGGTAEAKRVRLPFYLECPQLLHAAGLSNTNDSLVLTLRMPDGRILQRLVLARDPDKKAPLLWPKQELKPQPNPGEEKDWSAALAGKANDLLLFQGEPRPFFARALPDKRAFYIRFDANTDDGGMKIGDFVQKTFQEAVAARPGIVIVDMRMNGGGDYTSTAHFMRTLPEALPHARFYILTSENTFSAGMTSTAFLKQAAGDRGEIVGSIVGDRIRFNAEGSDFCLPYSKACMGLRTGIHDYSEKICTPLFRCFALNWLYPVAIRSFAPDIYAPLTFAALGRGHDPAIDAIFAADAAKRASSENP